VETDEGEAYLRPRYGFSLSSAHLQAP
jgi:hypothetical protein